MNKAPAFALSFLLIFTLAPQGFASTVPQEIKTYEGLLHAIRQTRAASEARIEAAVEQEKVREAWETGKLIDEHILLNKERAKYGERVLQRLSFDLVISQTELSYMLQFARAYPIYPRGDKLSWSHYRSLLAVNDSVEREALTRRAKEEGWNRDQMRAEVRKRNAQGATSSPNVVSVGPLPEITPGPLNTYQIIRLRDHLKIDLGFGIYHDVPKKDVNKFKEGDIVQVDPSLQGNAKFPFVREKSTWSDGGQTLERVAVGGLPALPVKPASDEAIMILKGASPADLFTYSAIVTQVVDGDTFHALIDLGFETVLAQRVRLRRIDAAEIETAEGKEAKVYLEKILFRGCTARSLEASAVGTRTTGDECCTARSLEASAVGTRPTGDECQGRILMKSVDIDQHGRPIADVWVQGKSIDQELLDAGLAVRVEE